jgi:hypothetical protein
MLLLHFSIDVLTWLNNRSDTSLEQDEQSKKRAGNAIRYYDAPLPIWLEIQCDESKEESSRCRTK